MTDRMDNAASLRCLDSARTRRAVRCAGGAINRFPRAAKAGAARSVSMNGASVATGIISAPRSSSGMWCARCAEASGITAATKSRPIRAIRRAYRKPSLRAAGTLTTLWRSRMAGPTIRQTYGSYARCATRSALPLSDAPRPHHDARNYSCSTEQRESKP